MAARTGLSALRLGLAAHAPSVSAGLRCASSRPLSSSARKLPTPFAALASRAYATRQVNHKKGSETIGELAQNAKEEAKGAGDTVLNVISGGVHLGQPGEAPAGTQTGKESFGDEVKQTMGGVTSLVEDVPRQTWIFGSAGLVPSASIYLARQASLAAHHDAGSLDAETALALLYHVQNIQITYGAIILSFLGALHWGMEFAKFGGEKGSNRYILGIVPVVLAWPSLLVGNQVALAWQFAAFALTWFLDSRATSAGWTPKWYSTYRWALTTGVGITILITLIGSSLLGPGGKAPDSQARLAAIQQKQRDHLASSDSGEVAFKGATKSGVTVTPVDEAYGVIRNEAKEKEDALKKRAEEKKKQEEAAKQEKDDRAQASVAEPKSRKPE